MSRNLQAELDAQADRWIAEHDPDADLWPDVDEGRVRASVSLSVAQVYADLAAMREGSLDRPPLPSPPADPCSWCGLASIKYRRSERHERVVNDVCGRCHEHFRRHGTLPSPKLNRRHARRTGISHFLPIAMGTTPKAEKRSRQLWELAAVREALVDVCAAFADQYDSRNGYLTAADSKTWLDMLLLVRNFDRLIAELRPQANRSADFDTYIESRRAPRRPIGRGR